MKYVALLRGINVGGNTKVEMKKLKALFESLGYEDVLTYVNSGNVLFSTTKRDTEALTSQLQHAIKTEFGMPIPVVVRSKEDILNLVKAIPKSWENNTEQKTDILFLWKEYDKKESLMLLSPTAGIETLKYVPGAILWNLDRINYNKSGMSKFIGTELYKHMTARNINTVRKLASLLT